MVTSLIPASLEEALASTTRPDFSKLPPIQLDSNQALEILETVSRQPETDMERKLHRFFESLVECGARVIVTEDVKLTQFVRKIPRGMEFSKDLDFHHGRVESVSNIIVGQKMTVDDNPHLKTLGAGMKVHSLVIANPAQDFSIDSASAHYFSLYRKTGVNDRKCENTCGDINVQIGKGGATLTNCVTGDLTLHMAPGIEPGFKTENFRQGWINIKDVKARDMDIKAAQGINFEGKNEAAKIDAVAAGEIYKHRMWSTLKAKSGTFIAGSDVNLSEDVNGGRETNLHIPEVKIQAGKNVRLTYGAIANADIEAGGDVYLEYTRPMTTLRCVAEGKTHLYGSQVSEITPDSVSRKGWELDGTANLQSAPRRGLDNASFARLINAAGIRAVLESHTAGQLDAGTTGSKIDGK